MYVSRMTSHLDLPEGRLAYDVHEPAGPARGLLLAVPGMGDLRSTYRHLVPLLTAAGYRVATADLRGHGESDTSFSAYGDEATAGDIVALAEALRLDGERVVVLGNSMAAGAAVIAAAERPDLIAGLVLSGPFVRDGEIGAGMRLMFRLLMQPAWIVPAWRAYLPSLFAGRHPDDFAEELDRVVAALRRPGHRRAFARTTRTTHAPAEAVVDRVAAPTLVVMGAADPDFPDPAAEAAWIAERTGGEVLLVEEAGHYPHTQRPEVVAPAVLALLDRVTAAA